MKIAVCDDNIDFANNMVKMVTKIFTNNHIPCKIQIFADGETLINYVLSKKYFDLILLDIDLPNVNGKTVAKELRKLDSNFHLVFISFFEKEVFNTFSYKISSFIPKSKINELLAPELLRIARMIEENSVESVSLEIYNSTDKREQILLPLKSIVYLESQNRKITLYSTNEKFTLTSIHFEKIKEALLPMGLVEIHRTCLLNPTYISSINANTVLLDNGQELAMSRRKRDAVLSSIANIAKGVV